MGGPVNSHLAQVQDAAPFFFVWLATWIMAAKLGRALIGWEHPLDAIEKNESVEGKTWLSRLNNNYYPRDMVLVPLGSSPLILQNLQTCKQRNFKMATLP